MINLIIDQRKSFYPAQYTDAPIELNDLMQLLNAGTKAPNHKKTNPWRFRLFEGKDKDALAMECVRLYKEKTPKESFKSAKVPIIEENIKKTGAIISIGVHLSDEVPEWEEIAAVAMGVQNMYLLCTEKGLGCYWSSPKYSAFLADFLKMKPNEKCLGLFYIGQLKSEFKG